MRDFQLWKPDEFSLKVLKDLTDEILWVLRYLWELGKDEWTAKKLTLDKGLYLWKTQGVEKFIEHLTNFSF